MRSSRCERPLRAGLFQRWAGPKVKSMRRLFVSNVMSLDGFFEGPNKEFNFFAPDADFFEYAKDMLRSVDTILFGKTTYLYMAAYWPSADKDEIADKMNGLAKIVFSTTLDKAEWNNSRLVKRDIVAEVSRLKQEPGKDMVVLGSAMLASYLLQEGLIDEYRVIRLPSCWARATCCSTGSTANLT